MSWVALSDSQLVELTIVTDDTVVESPFAPIRRKARATSGTSNLSLPPRPPRAAASEPITAARALPAEVIRALFDLDPRFHPGALDALASYSSFDRPPSSLRIARAAEWEPDDEQPTIVRTNAAEGAVPRSRVALLEPTDVITRPPNRRARVVGTWFRLASLARGHGWRDLVRTTSPTHRLWALTMIAIAPILALALVATMGRSEERAVAGGRDVAPAVAAAPADAAAKDLVADQWPGLAVGPLPGTTDVLVPLGPSPVDVPDLGEGGPHEFVAMMDGRVSARGSIPAGTSFGASRGGRPAPVLLRLTLPPLDGVARAIPPAFLAEQRPPISGSPVRVVTDPPGARVYVRVRAVLLGLPAQGGAREAEGRAPIARSERTESRFVPTPPVTPPPRPVSPQATASGPLPGNPY